VHGGNLTDLRVYLQNQSSAITSHVEGALSELMYCDTYNILMNGQLWSFSVRENTRTFAKEN